jgi:hypothetical protein
MMLMKNLLEVSSSSQPYELLEISLLEAAAHPNEPSGEDQSLFRGSNSENTLPNNAKDQSTLHKPLPKSPNKGTIKSSFTVEQWPEIVKQVKNEAASLYTALRLATPELNDETLMLKFQFPLHQKKIDQAAVKSLISQLIEDNFGSRLAIICLVDKSIAPDIKTSDENTISEPPSSSFQSISNIFGAAEVLES